MCIKHEHKEHQVITWCGLVECKDKETTKSKAEVLGSKTQSSRPVTKQRNQTIQE